MVDVETQAILLEVQAAAAPPAALLDFAVQVFGRLIGETMAHEIIHSLLGVSVGNIGADGHNAPPVAGELMNDWLNRSFQQRTGLRTRRTPARLTQPILSITASLRLVSWERTIRR